MRRTNPQSAIGNPRSAIELGGEGFKEHRKVQELESERGCATAGN
jgi:hypothetical protein